MNEEIKVIIKEPECNPHEELISNSLKSLQEIVGGYIEVFRVSDTLAVICNEEGKLGDYKYNVTLDGEQLFGTIIFVGVKETDDGEDFTDYPIDGVDTNGVRYTDLHCYDKKRRRSIPDYDYF